MFSLCFLSFSLFLLTLSFPFSLSFHSRRAHSIISFNRCHTKMHCVQQPEKMCASVWGCARMSKRASVWERERERDVPFKAQSEFYWSGIREVCFMFLFNTNGKKFRQQKKFQNKNWNKKIGAEEKNGFRGNDKFSAKFFAFGLRPVVGIINLEWW